MPVHASYAEATQCCQAASTGVHLREHWTPCAPQYWSQDRINNCDPGCALVCRLPVSQSAHLQERCMAQCRTAALQPNLCCWSALQT